MKTKKAIIIEQPQQAVGKRRRAPVAVLMDTDDVVKEQFGGFVSFIREHAIVGVAVGFVVGQQAQGVVKQLITSFIEPTFQLIFGTSLASQQFTLHLGSHEAKYNWGGMISILINLLFVLATIYVLIKVFKLDKLDKPKEVVEVKPATKRSRKKAKRATKQS